MIKLVYYYYLKIKFKMKSLFKEFGKNNIRLFNKNMSFRI